MVARRGGAPNDNGVGVGAAAVRERFGMLSARQAPAGALVYLDDADLPALESASAWLRTASPSDVGSVRVVPLLADPADGLWVVRIEPRS